MAAQATVATRPAHALRGRRAQGYLDVLATAVHPFYIIAQLVFLWQKSEALQRYQMDIVMLCATTILFMTVLVLE